MPKLQVIITEEGVSIKSQMDLYDVDGNFVENKRFLKSVGLNDYATVEDFRLAVQDSIGNAYGKPFTDSIAEIKEAADNTVALQAQLNAANTSHAQIVSGLTSERDNAVQLANALQAERAQLVSERNAALAAREIAIAERDAAIAANQGQGNGQGNRS